MPAINVNPMRPASARTCSQSSAGRMGAPGFPILGRNESALRKSPAALLRRKSAVPARRGPSKG